MKKFCLACVAAGVAIAGGAVAAWFAARPIGRAPDADARLEPSALVAVTVNVYGCWLTRPPTVTASPVPLVTSLAPPGLALTV